MADSRPRRTPLKSGEMMKGIILAAGRGLRLNGETGSTPKCLMEIGGSTLLERQIEALRAAGVDDIVVVVGYRAERVRRAGGEGVRYVENTRFDQTNSLYSLWLAREHFAGGFVVMNSDVLFHPRMLADLIAYRQENALLIAYRDRAEAEAMGYEEMKVKVHDGRVADISKAMAPQEADGENVGMVKFGADGARLLRERMDALIAAGCHNDWAPKAFCEFASRHPLYVLGTDDYPWIEIDFPEDYEKAVNEVLPAILATPPGTRNREASATAASSGINAWGQPLGAPAPLEPY